MMPIGTKTEHTTTDPLWSGYHVQLWLKSGLCLFTLKSSIIYFFAFNQQVLANQELPPVLDVGHSSIGHVNLPDQP